MSLCIWLQKVPMPRNLLRFDCSINKLLKARFALFRHGKECNGFVSSGWVHDLLLHCYAQHQSTNRFLVKAKVTETSFFNLMYVPQGKPFTENQCNIFVAMGGSLQTGLRYSRMSLYLYGRVSKLSMQYNVYLPYI